MACQTRSLVARVRAVLRRADRGAEIVVCPDDEAVAAARAGAMATAPVTAGVVVGVDPDTGRATSIERVQVRVD